MRRFTDEALNGKKVAKTDGSVPWTYSWAGSSSACNDQLQGRKKRFQKIPDQADIALILKTESVRASEWCPTFQLPVGFNTRQPIESHGLTHIHHFYTGRNRIALAAFNSLCEHPLLKSLVTTVAFRITKRYGLTYQAGTWGAGGGPTNGTLYIPSLVKELNMFEMLDNAISKMNQRRKLKSWMQYCPRNQRRG